MKFYNESELYNTIGQNIKFYRKEASLTQQELAEKTQISISYLSKIEANGCEKSISLSALNQIANELNIDIKEFFTRRK